MQGLIPTVAAGVVAPTLLLAGGAHLAHPDRLRQALTSHRLLPAPGLVAAAAAAAETATGGVGTVALLAGAAGPLQVSLAVAAVLLGGYAGYSWYVLLFAGGGPCGCGRADQPVTGWVVARAAVLAGAALLGAGTAGSVLPVDRAGVGLAVALLAAPAFAALLWALPAAMHDPYAARVPGGVR